MPVRALAELPRVIRSKNAGPFEITLDLIFPDREIYERVKASGVLTRDRVAELYRIPIDDVYELVYFDPALAIKVTMARQRPQGSIGESDTYGAQQHAPLLGVTVPWDDGSAPAAAADYAFQFNPGFLLDPDRAALVVVDMQYASA